MYIHVHVRIYMPIYYKCIHIFYPQIIQARADELVYLQNESKLEQVQLQFPNDALDMFEVS